MNLLSYDEQIYLIYHWMRTTLKGVEPTLTNIANLLNDEFEIEDITVARKIFDLFHN